MSNDTFGAANPTAQIIDNRQKRYILPYTPPVAGNQIVGEEQNAAAAASRQQQQSVQLTDFTYIQQTEGEGVGAFTVAFDVAFTSEPVVSYGTALADFAAVIRDDLAVATANAAQATENAAALTYKFPMSVTISAFESYSPTSSIPEYRYYKFATTGLAAGGVVNSQKVTLTVTVGTHTYQAGFKDGSGFVIVNFLDDLTKATWTLSYSDVVQASLAGSRHVGTVHPWVTKGEVDAKAAAEVSTTQDIVGDTLRLGGDLSIWPVCNVYVKRWLINDQSNYIGAECIVVVRRVPVIAPAAPTPSSDSSSEEVFG